MAILFDCTFFQDDNVVLEGSVLVQVPQGSHDSLAHALQLSKPALDHLSHLVIHVIKRTVQDVDICVGGQHASQRNLL